MSQPTSGYLYSTNIVSVKASSTISGTANTTGVNLSQYSGNGITLIFNCSAVAGGGSLAESVEESYDDSTYAAISGATTTVAAAGVTLLFIPNFQGPYLRVAQTLTGTSVTYSILAYGQPGESTSSEGYTTSPVGQAL